MSKKSSREHAEGILANAKKYGIPLKKKDDKKKK